MVLPNLTPFTSFLLFLLLCPQPPSAAAAASYFIDCGTSATTTDDGQSFTGDTTLPTGVKLSTKSSKTVTDTSNSSQADSSLYKTARVFTFPASYQFDTSDAGTYLLRLHFFALSSSYNLTSAQFNVSANGHMLLPSFTGSETSSSSVKKEFLLPVEAGEDLKVYFVPTGFSGLAFVNAIEVIFAPLNLTDINTPLKITPTGGYNGSFGNLGSKVLRPIYRIDVGSNSNVSSSEDKLRRVWLQDHPYLVAGTSYAKQQGPENINYRHENATVIDAPNQVYSTARGWKFSDPTNLLKATWRFNVSRSSNYFVRVHLCDILSSAAGEIKFNLYFYTNFVWNVFPFNVTINDQSPAPFCLDFVVKSDDMGFISLTIGSRKDSLSQGAFLNGLEIMEFVTGSAKEPIIPSKGQDVALIAGLVAGGFALIFVLVVGFVWVLLRRRKRSRPVEEFDWPLAALNGGNSESKTTSDKTASRSSLSSLPSLHLRIPFAVIQQVTNDFDESLVIGRGGFGKVYKGVLKNGEKVAVKRSDSRHGQGLPEFQTEITVLSKIRHRHLVSLIGYCDENGEMILVYEYMEKGTLRDHLYGSSLPWKQRLEICIGAAKGLHYLHTGSTGGIIHRDVKSTNILLDENYLAKVADFGLSRIGALDQETHVSTLVKGTFGYLDPEYYQCMQLTEKSDVYSFGVLLLEVLCARPVLDTSLPREQVNLADWAMSCKEKGEIDMIIDPSLAGQINPNSLKKFVETGEKCLRESGADRPPMSDVLWDLEYTLQLQKFGGQEGGFVDTTSTTEASFNLPMLAVPCLSTTSFAIEEESGAPIDDVSGLCGDSGGLSTGKLKLDDSV